jgi:hypothetical protein
MSRGALVSSANPDCAAPRTGIPHCVRPERTRGELAIRCRPGPPEFAELAAELEKKRLKLSGSQPHRPYQFVNIAQVTVVE